MKPPEQPPRPDSLEQRVAKLEESLDDTRGTLSLHIEASRSLKSILAHDVETLKHARTVDSQQVEDLATAQAHLSDALLKLGETPSSQVVASRWTTFRAWGVVASVTVLAGAAVWMLFWLRGR